MGVNMYYPKVLYAEDTALAIDVKTDVSNKDKLIN